MRLKKQCLTLLILLFFFSIGLKNAHAVMDYYLSLEAIPDGASIAQTEFSPGDAFYLHIGLNNAADIAGVAFTLTYDNTKVTGPPTNAEGLPVIPNDITSLFPFTFSTTKTHRANSSEPNKIYLAGAEIASDGGAKYTGGDITLFTIKFEVKGDAAPIDTTHLFTLEPTQLFNPAAGLGTDNDGNGVFSAGDTKDIIPVLVGAIPNTNPNWGGDLSDDFPNHTSFMGYLPSLEINLTCLDSDSDGLCNGVETNTETYNNPDDTGTDPNNADSDGDGLNDGLEVTSLGTNPTLSDTDDNGTPDGAEDYDGDGFSNVEELQCESDPTDSASKCKRVLPFMMLLLD
jgi:hypothetical protein